MVMRKKVFKTVMSAKGFERIANSILEYSATMQSKVDTFVLRLAELGIPIVEQRINQAYTADSLNHYTYIDVKSFGDYAQARLIVEGQDIAFIEFGAGVHYNGPVGQSPNPKGQELGLTIGSYGNGKGAKDTWVYQGNNGDWIVTHGTKATMPLYSASLEIINNIVLIAKEVFGG